MPDISTASSVKLGNLSATEMWFGGTKIWPILNWDWATTNLPTVPYIDNGWYDAWYAGTFGGGRFVVIANDADTAAYSDDGITWTASNLPTSSKPNWMAVTYGGGRFVAVSASGSSSPDPAIVGNAAYSDDGITWTASTLPTGANWQFVKYGGGRFVVTARDGAAYSDNGGITWTAFTLPTSNWASVTYGEGRFVAVVSGWGNAAYNSDDGITWTAFTLPTSANWQFVKYGGGRFVAVSAKTDAAYSDDGITWTSSTLPDTGRDWYDGTFGGGRFVVIGWGTNKAAYSDDCITWTPFTLPGPATYTIIFGGGYLSAPPRWSCVLYGAGRFVAIANTTHHYGIPHGSTFTGNVKYLAAYITYD